MRAPCGPCLLWVLPCGPCLPVGNPATTVLYSTAWLPEPWELLCLCVPPLPGLSTNSSPSSASLGRNLRTSTRIPASGRTPWLRLPPVSMSRLWRLSSTGTTVRTCLPTRLVVGSLKLRWQCRTKIKNGFIRVTAVEVSLGSFAGSGCLNVLWETFEEQPFATRHFSRMF